MSSTKQAQSATWFLPALTLIFITLKLTGHIAWSWWWVLAPLWIPAIIVIVVLCIFLWWRSRSRGGAF